MKRLSPTRTSTPERRIGIIQGRRSYRNYSMPREMTFSTESPIVARKGSSKRGIPKPKPDGPKMNLFSRYNLLTPIVIGLLLGSGIGCIIPMYMISWLVSQVWSQVSSTEIDISAEFSLRTLYSKYSDLDSNIFDELEACMPLIKGGMTLSFVFAYSSNEALQNMTENMSTDVALMAADYLGNGIPVTVTYPDSMKTEFWDPNADYGELLEDWKPQMLQSRVMLVENLQRVPPHLALAFHVLCDEHTTFVNGSLYLHTVDIGTRNSSGSDRSAVENRLRQSWPYMTNDKFEPLLTRIAGSVFSIA